MIFEEYSAAKFIRSDAVDPGDQVGSQLEWLIVF